MAKGNLILEGTHNNEKIGAKVFPLWSILHLRQGRGLLSRVPYDPKVWILLNFWFNLNVCCLIALKSKNIDIRNNNLNS
jgi:hypothetical protein